MVIHIEICWRQIPESHVSFRSLEIVHGHSSSVRCNESQRRSVRVVMFNLSTRKMTIWFVTKQATTICISAIVENIFFRNHIAITSLINFARGSVLIMQSINLSQSKFTPILYGMLFKMTLWSICVEKVCHIRAWKFLWIAPHEQLTQSLVRNLLLWTKCWDWGSWVSKRRSQSWQDWMQSILV